MTHATDTAAPATADELGPRRDGLITTRLSDVRPEAIDWLWPGRFARGKLTLLIGDPGDGKSFVTHDMAARVSTGAAWCDGGRAPLGHTFLIAAEDGLADTVRPRLDALGGDASRVEVIQGIVENQQEQALTLSPPFRRHLHGLIADRGAVLVIIDPLAAYLGKADSYKDAEVRGLLMPLAALAERTGVALVGIMHLTKDDQRRILYRQGGSIGFTATARMVLVVTRDPNDRERRLLVCSKTNIGRTPPPLAFRIEAVGPDPYAAARLVWEATPAEDVDVDALFVVGGRASRPSAVDQAKGFLHQLLSNGPMPSTAVVAAAEQNGIAERTLRRAKDALGVTAERAGGVAEEGAWWWCLPGQQPTASLPQLATLGVEDRGTAEEPATSTKAAASLALAILEPSIACLAALDTTSPANMANSLRRPAVEEGATLATLGIGASCD